MSRGDCIEAGIGAVLRASRLVFNGPESFLRVRCRLGSSDPYIIIRLIVVLGCWPIVAHYSANKTISCAAAAVSIYVLTDLITHHLYSFLVEPIIPRSAIRVVEIAAINCLQSGICFGFIYYLIEVWVPRSFGPRDEVFGIGQAMYLSLLTITNLGSGNVVPLNAVGKVVVVIEAFVGLMLIAFVIVRHMAYYAEWQSRDGQRQDGKD